MKTHTTHSLYRRFALLGAAKQREQTHWAIFGGCFVALCYSAFFTISGWIHDGHAPDYRFFIAMLIIVGFMIRSGFVVRKSARLIQMLRVTDAKSGFPIDHSLEIYDWERFEPISIVNDEIPIESFEASALDTNCNDNH